jgi:hypothetical protein
MKIHGRLVRGDQPVRAPEGGRLALSLIGDKGEKFNFDTQPDGSFSGPNADDQRPFPPGKYTVLLFRYQPGARGPDVTHLPGGVEVVPGKTEYQIDVTDPNKK